MKYKATPVQSKNVGASYKPKKPRVKMQSIKKEVQLHMEKLKNDLR